MMQSIKIYWTSEWTHAYMLTWFRCRQKSALYTLLKGMVFYSISSSQASQLPKWEEKIRSVFNKKYLGAHKVCTGWGRKSLEDLIILETRDKLVQTRVWAKAVIMGMEKPGQIFAWQNLVSAWIWRWTKSPGLKPFWCEQKNLGNSLKTIVTGLLLCKQGWLIM